MSEVFKLAHVDMTAPRIELHNALALTGCEVSISNIAAGVLAGKGELYIDGKVVQIEKGDWFRIDPEGRRAIRAAADSSITLICVQTRKGSLGNYTMTDGVLVDDRAPWL